MYAVGCNFKMQYFDRAVISKRFRYINREPLKRAGLIVMLNARQSIRSVPAFTKKGKRTNPSLPGRPPKSRKGGSVAPFKMIYSVPGSMGLSTIVGMVGFGGMTPVPGLHEHGGLAVRSVRKLSGTSRGKKKNYAGKWKTFGGKKTFIPDLERKTVTYPARPFMNPALKKTRNKFPALWKNSLRGIA